MLLRSSGPMLLSHEDLLSVAFLAASASSSTNTGISDRSTMCRGVLGEEVEGAAGGGWPPSWLSPLGGGAFCFSAILFSSRLGAGVPEEGPAAFGSLVGATLATFGPSGMLKADPSFFRRVPLRLLSQGCSCSSTLRTSCSFFALARSSLTRCLPSNQRRVPSPLCLSSLPSSHLFRNNSY